MSSPLAELQGRLYLDQDVRVQLAGMLRSESIDAITTLDEGRLGAEDEAQLKFAASVGRAILTHNRLDFESLHRQWLADERSHPGILIAVQRRDLRITLARILDLLNRLDRDQLRNGVFYV
jgi:hypothetical protein